MRTPCIAAALAILAVSVFSAPVIAQGTIFAYTIHVDFFALSCSLSIYQVSLYDSSGDLIGATSSPLGAEVAITFRTSVPISAITATASGLASFASYYTWQVNGSRSMTLSGAGDYWITIRMN